MKVTIVAAALAVMPRQALAQRATSPADATVFVRLVGSVHIEYEGPDGRQAADVDHVEIGSGSGFVLSPYGYVLTNEHVIRNPDQLKLTKGLQRATVSMKVASIDVCFRPDAAAAHGMSEPCLTASVTASDPAQDLAVLYISGASFPYVALGDSDAIAAGTAVDALGYPFGRDVEVGKVATVQDIVPDVSTTPGSVSAFRTNDAGARQYLQITNSVNPGNSGGPIVTRDGFAVGVLRSRLTNATGIGFAITINTVKDFLESRGLDQLMPVRRLRLGSLQTFEAKGMALRLPDGFGDVSPFPSRLESAPRPGEIELRVDRVRTPWSAKRIQDALIGTRTFETLPMTAREVRNPPETVEASLLLGGAVTAEGDTAHETRMDYAVRDLNSEKLVARYVGPAEWMAFNESILRASLGSLQGRQFGVEPLAPATLSWATASGASEDGSVPMPAGWVGAPGALSSCGGLAQPSASEATSPAQDSTIQLRAAVWLSADVAPAAAASACAARRGSLGEASYTQSTTWLGVPYVIEGVFVRVGSRLVRLEVVSTDQRRATAQALLAAWLQKVTHETPGTPVTASARDRARRLDRSSR
jgi:S1-C subfamily serine protease